MQIPPLIHQTWETRDVPRAIYPPHWLNSWRECHPTWPYRLWTDADLADLARAKYPDFLPVFGSTAPGVVKADFGRLLVLHELGGLYADLDYLCLKPFGPLLRANRLLLSTMQAPRPYVHNALLATIPGHPFIMSVLHRALHTFHTAAPLPRPELVAGPDVFSSAAATCHGGDLTLAPPEQLCPLSWLNPHDVQRRPRLEAMSLEQLRANFPQAYALTFWWHNW